MATQKITLAIVPFLALAITKAIDHRKKAINTSRYQSSTAKSSEDRLLKEKKQK